MWRKLSNWLHRKSNGWVAAASLLVFLFFTALILPDQAYKSESALGTAGSPDMSFYYSPEELYQMAESYGAEGRQAYIRARFTFDLVWPLVYGIFLSAGISWLFRHEFSAEAILQRANLVPVLAVMFDYLENVSASLVISRFPSSTAVLDALASGFTMTKWIFVAGSFAFLLVGIVVGISQWVSARDSH